MSSNGSFLQVPCLTYGMRGMISASIEVKGPQRDLHSGNEGGMTVRFPDVHTFSFQKKHPCMCR